jgi:hypothetical protein
VWVLVRLANVHHHFDPETCVKLNRRVKAALKPGGTAAVVDFLADEARRENAAALLFGIVMMSWSPRGNVFTGSEYRDFFHKAGFKLVSVARSAQSPQAVLLARYSSVRERKLWRAKVMVPSASIASIAWHMLLSESCETTRYEAQMFMRSCIEEGAALRHTLQKLGNRPIMRAAIKLADVLLHMRDEDMPRAGYVAVLPLLVTAYVDNKHVLVAAASIQFMHGPLLRP